MNRLAVLMACTFFTVISYTAKTQDIVKQAEDKDSKRDAKTYIINSLEGKNCIIHIMPNYFGHVLKISYLKDTISIYDYWGVPVDVKFLNKNFMEIDYAVRGGSNLGIENTLLLCVVKNKLHNALHILKNTTWDSGGVKEVYDIKLKLNLTDDIAHSKLNADVTDLNHLREDPDNSYDYHNLSFLSFDTKIGVFYSIKQTLFSKLSYRVQNKIHYKLVRGDFPMAILGKEIYYYIDGIWCQMDDSNKLSEFEN